MKHKLVSQNFNSFCNEFEIGYKLSRNSKISEKYFILGNFCSYKNVLISVQSFPI